MSDSKAIPIPIRIISEAEPIPIRAIGNKKAEKTNILGFCNKIPIKLLIIVIIIGISWINLSSGGGTIAYFNDSEYSRQNLFTAGILDFTLSSSVDPGTYFFPMAIWKGEWANKVVHFINSNNIPKYKVAATEFSGTLCDYLILSADLDGGDIEYVGNLKDFNFGPVVFEEPDDWDFILGLRDDAPESIEGANCQFKFVFFGSQVKNNLPFGLGFSDSEEIENNISAKICRNYQVRSKGYWKNHGEIYSYLLPQTLGSVGEDIVVDSGEEANAIFVDYNLSMRNKLKGQLLAMKFNIAYLQIGDYWVQSGGKTLNEIVIEADDLLRDSDASSSDLEEMKNLLEDLNDAGLIKFCKAPGTGGSQPNLFIEKVYYDVDSKHGNDNDNEWVEIFNPSEFPVDLNGWQICDDSQCDTINDNILFPNQFAIITNKNTTWNYWDIKPDVLKIKLGNKIGDGLDNDSDMLILKDSAGEIIDQMNWGMPDHAWPNYNSDIWEPGASGVPEGCMLARVPADQDTDSLSDFKQLCLPAVQVLVPNGGEVWWVGRTYSIQWIATNPNGMYSDLKIDIYYSADSGDTWGTIIKGIENNGSYDWRVPLSLGGYLTPSHRARVKVVATGPENVMVQGQDESDADFCPPIDYALLTPDELDLLHELWLEDENSIPSIIAEQETFSVAKDTPLESEPGSDPVSEFTPVPDVTSIPEPSPASVSEPVAAPESDSTPIPEPTPTPVSTPELTPEPTPNPEPTPPEPTPFISTTPETAPEQSSTAELALDSTSVPEPVLDSVAEPSVSTIENIQTVPTSLEGITQ